MVEGLSAFAGAAAGVSVLEAGATDDASSFPPTLLPAGGVAASLLA